MKIAALLLALTLPAAALGQPKTPDPGKLLGQTPETGALPLWSQPSADARQDLGKQARAAERGVILLGFPKVGTGTGWVISKKNRLVVTNAHVADLMHRTDGKLLAIPSGTSQLYKVEKAWYHPGVRRFLKNSPNLSVRSTDPKDGPVDPASPDLAVVRLAAGGPDLETEFAPAAEAEVAELFAQPAAIFGFPGHDTKGWPGLGEEAAATYHDGVVSRLTDFQFRPGGPYAERQFVQYTMSEWGGFSGSPVFLRSGRVAAVHNMARTVEDKGSGERKVIPHGVRVDCVFELLVHHKLADKVPFKIDESKVLVERWLKPDPRTEKALADFDKAEQLVIQARLDIFTKQEFKKGIDKCNKALDLLPSYAPAYQVRSYGWNNYFGFHQDNLNTEQKLDYLQRAYDDIQKYMQLLPSDQAGPVIACQVKNNAGIVQDAARPLRESLSILNKVLEVEGLKASTRAEAHSYRATAHDFLGNADAARRDHGEALRLMPEVPILWENRALFWDKNGRPDLAAADRAKAREVRRLARTGLKITEVKDGGPAQKAKMRVGDVILEVEGKRVHTFAELTAVLGEAKGPVDVVFISTDGRSLGTTVTPNDGKVGIAVEPAELE
jgi:tetratricopeptide (TPR) repeat protein